MRPVLFATFAKTVDADKALGALFDNGVLSEDVTVIAPETYRAETRLPEHAQVGITTTTAGDAASGAAKGGVIGLSFGSLAAVASLAIPGFGLVLGGGALAAAISGAVGATAAGALAGGVTGYLKDQGVPEPITQRYAHSLATGGALVGVSVPSNNVGVAVVREMLLKYGGMDVHSVELPPRTTEVPIDEPIAEREPIVVDRTTGERIE